MKLYTEEQVRQMLSKVRGDIWYSDNELFATQPPIELPSDEEIKEYINSTPYYGHCTTEYCEGIEDGIKWILTKI